MVVDTVNNVITAHTTHFSIFGVFAETPAKTVNPDGTAPSFALNARFLLSKRVVTVSYTLPSPSAVEISLFNARGVCLQRRFMTQGRAGSSTATLDCREFGNGIYVVAFRAGAYRVNRAVTFLK